MKMNLQSKTQQLDSDPELKASNVHRSGEMADEGARVDLGLQVEQGLTALGRVLLHTAQAHALGAAGSFKTKLVDTKADLEQPIASVTAAGPALATELYSTTEADEAYRATRHADLEDSAEMLLGDSQVFEYVAEIGLRTA
jgi:hypothetical protein